MSQRTILITGVAGFIGSNLAEALLQRGYSVVGMDNLSQGQMPNIADFQSHSDFKFVEADVRDEATVLNLCDGIGTIVHLAAFKIPRYGGAIDTLLINAHGTENVLKAAVQKKCRVIFASTSDVYGKNPNLPFSEESDLYLGATNVKRWAYAGSKILDEHLAFAYAQEYGLSVVGVRFFGGYGPRQHLTWWGGPQSVFIDAALNDKEMEVHGDGKQTRSFTYIDDTVDGLLRIIETKEADGHVLNIGNTREITIYDLAVLIWELVRTDEPKIRFISYQTFGKYDDVRRRIPDLSKARQILGYVPKVDLEVGLRKTIEWQKSVSGSASA
jgi:UDP-glucose 4-epimerase